MSECNHTHTSSCSPAGIYLYVTCMDCGAILNESPEGARLRNECPKFEAEQFSRGSCKHCHHSAQYHYDALAAENAELRKDAKRYRWLRRGNYSIETARSILNDTAEGIDATIDAAMKQSQ